MVVLIYIFFLMVILKQSSWQSCMHLIKTDFTDTVAVFFFFFHPHNNSLMFRRFEIIKNWNQHFAIVLWWNETVGIHYIDLSLSLCVLLRADLDWQDQCWKFRRSAGLGTILVSLWIFIGKVMVLHNMLLAVFYWWSSISAVGTAAMKKFD